MAMLILGWAAVAMFMSCVAAAAGDRFPRFEDAVVLGALTAVTWVVVLVAFVATLDKKWRN